jgi:hypothetical protein
MEAARDDLTSGQWRKKYEQLEAEHLQLKRAKADAEAQHTDAVKELKARHAAEMGAADRKHKALEAEHSRFKTLHSDNPYY